MTWQPMTTINPTGKWQVTDPVEGEFFKLAHTTSDLPTEYFRGELAQVEQTAEGEYVIFDVQEIEASPEAQVLALPKPACFNERRIAIRAIRDEVQIAPYGRPYSWAISVERFDSTPPPPPPPAGVERLFQTIGDTNGVFYFAGTNWGGQETFTNPQTVGTVAVTARSVLFDSLGAVTARDTSEFVSGDATFEQWVQFDLKTKRVRPTHYQLETRSAGFDDFLRSWRWEATDDPATGWTVLDEHTNDAAFNTVNQKLVFPLTSNEDFRYWRLYQTGLSSSGRKYLTLGSVELYGYVFDAT